MPPFIFGAIVGRSVTLAIRESDGSQRTLMGDTFQSGNDGVGVGGTSFFNSLGDDHDGIIRFQSIRFGRLFAGAFRISGNKRSGYVIVQLGGQTNTPYKAVVAIGYILPEGVAFQGNLVTKHGQVLRPNAGVGRLLLEVVGGFARGQHHNHVRAFRFDALDDTGKVLRANVYAKGNGVNARFGQPIGGIFGGRNAIIGVFGDDDHFADAGQTGNEFDIYGRYLRTERRNTENFALHVAGNSVIPRFGEYGWNAIVVSDFFGSATHRTVVAAAYGHDVILVDQFFHHGRAPFRQPFRIHNDQFNRTPQNAAGFIEFIHSNNHGVAHRFAANYCAGSGQWGQTAKFNRLTSRLFHGSLFFGHAFFCRGCFLALASGVSGFGFGRRLSGCCVLTDNFLRGAAPAGSQNQRQYQENN